MGLSETELELGSKKIFHQRLVETGPGVKKIFQPELGLGSKIFFRHILEKDWPWEKEIFRDFTRTGVNKFSFNQTCTVHRFCLKINPI